MRQVLCWLALVAACLLAAPVPAEAGLSALSIFPSRHALEVAPGSATTVSVNVVNNGDEPLRIRAYAADWTLGQTGEMAFWPAGKVPHSAHHLVAVAPAQFVLPPGKTQRVRLQVTVPPGTAGGEYHGMVFFETGPQRAEVKRRGATMLFNQRIGETIYVAVPPVRKQATVKGLAYMAPEKGQPPRIGLALENTGTVHVRGTAKLTIAQPDGRPVLALPVEDLTLLRESRRLFYVPLKAPLAPGRYRASLSFDYGGEALVEAETHLAI
jgi:P pilus assembly chaperone PapD